MLNQRELCAQTNLKPRQVDNLVRNYTIPPKYVQRFGKGIPRKFDPKAVKIIKKWKEEKAIE
ncbi:MAG: hypothetical protein K9M80_07630 [Candidatus Marinimicrobia bacterium]|nr:hypothetical protein [Candidatus Neomarinimicrobiota bacterium]